MSTKLKSIKNEHVISDSEDMWVLASPIRMEVLNAACALEECSAGEIAVFTGRSRTSIYPHIEQLVEAGLMFEGDVRLAGKRYEQLYHPVARTIRILHNLSDPDVVAYHQAFGKSVCRMAARVYTKAMTNPKAVVRGPLRDTYIGIVSTWLDDESLEEVNRLIDQIWLICESSKPGEGKRRVNFEVMLAPDSEKTNAFPSLKER